MDELKLMKSSYCCLTAAIMAGMTPDVPVKDICEKAKAIVNEIYDSEF